MWKKLSASLAASFPVFCNYIPQSRENNLKVFAGSSSRELASEISGYLGVQLGRMFNSSYPDGETRVRLFDEVSGKQVFIVQSLSEPVHDNLVELLYMVSTFKNSGAQRVVVVVPYLCYSRQDIPQPRKPGSLVADIARMLETMGADAIIGVDLHGDQIKGYLSVPFFEIKPFDLAVEYLSQKNLKDPVIISPDVRGSLRAAEFQSSMLEKGIECDIALLPKPGGSLTYLKKTLHAEYLGKRLTGRDLIIVDDMVITGTNLLNCVEELRQRDSERIFMYATHGLLAKGAIEKINQTSLTELILTNSIHSNTNSSKVTYISLAKVIAQQIKQVYGSNFNE